MRRAASVSVVVMVLGISLGDQLVDIEPPALADSLPTSSNATELSKAVRVDRELIGGAQHSFQISLSLNQYLAASVQTFGGSARLTVYGPAQERVLEVDCFQARFAPISFVAETAGIFRIEVLSLTTHPARYSLQVGNVRSSNSTDKTAMAAEAAFHAGEKSRREWTSASLAKAIERFELAASLWESIGRRPEAAAAHRVIGDTWFVLDEPQKALSAYATALSFSRMSKDQSGTADSLNGLGYIHLTFGEHRTAQKYFSEGLALSRAAGTETGEAYSLNNLGELCYARRELEESLKYYRQALSHWEKSDDLEGQALAHLNFAYTYNDLSDTTATQDSLDLALSFWQKSGNRRGEGLTITALGHLYSKIGDKQRALDFYRRARELFEPMDNKVGQAFVYNGVGYVYEELGETEKALENYLNAFKLFSANNYREGQAGSLYKIGKAYFSLGNYDEALNYYKQSRLVSRQIGDRRMEAVPVKLIGKTLAAQGKQKQALVFYTEALSLNRAGSDRREEAYTLRDIGDTYHQLGENRQALRYFSEALSLNRATGDKFGECSTLYSVAATHRALKNLSEAHSIMETGLALAESLRTSVASHELRASYFATVRQAYNFQIDILMQMHNQYPDRGHEIRAFELSERARARSFLESLLEAQAGIRDHANTCLIEKQKAIEEQLDAQAVLHRQLLASHKTDEVKASADRISDLTAQYDQVSVEIRLTNPRYAALAQPQPLTLTAIQEQVLDGDSVLLEYALGDARSYVWVVTRDGITSRELPAQSEIEKTARTIYQLLTANQPLPAETFEQRQERINRANEELPLHLTQLSRMVVDPVSDKLGQKRLIVVPDGALQYIPFQILNVPVDTNRVSDCIDCARKSLLNDHELIYEASASTLASLSKEAASRDVASGDVVVMADPVFEADDVRVKGAGSPTPDIEHQQTGRADVHRALDDAGVVDAEGRIPRLQASRNEADAIMSVTQWGLGYKATGFEANRDAAMKPSLADYRIVHFATHGLMNAKHPELSGIVLSLVDEKGNSQNGFLRLHDIYNMKLPVDLVVLSACNTGLGKDVKGEGLIGLTRGFMYAGASSVVASLWKVDDEATAELMKHFYFEMLQQGLSPAAALRKAQLEMSKQKRWQSPYYWSGFTIQGQYVQSQRPTRASASTRTATAGLCVAILLVAFMGWKQRRIKLL